VIRGCKFEEK